MGKTRVRIDLGRRNQEFYNKHVKFKMPTRHPSRDSMEAVGYMITVVIDSVKKKNQKYHTNYFSQHFTHKNMILLTSQQLLTYYSGFRW